MNRHKVKYWLIDAASTTSGSHVALLQLPFLAAASTTSRFHVALLCFLFALQQELLVLTVLYCSRHNGTHLLILTVLYCFPFLSAASTTGAPKALLQEAQVLFSQSFTAGSTSSVLTELYCSKHKFWCSQSFTAASTSSGAHRALLQQAQVLVLTEHYCSKHKFWCSQSITAASTSSGAHRALLQQAQVLVLTEHYCSKHKFWCSQSFTAASTSSDAHGALLQQAQVLVLTEHYCSKHKFCSHRALLQQAQVLVLTEHYCSKHRFCSHRALLQQAQVQVLTELYCIKHKFWCSQSFTKFPFLPAARTTYSHITFLQQAQLVLTKMFCIFHFFLQQAQLLVLTSEVWQESGHRGCSGCPGQRACGWETLLRIDLLYGGSNYWMSKDLKQIKS